MEKVYEYRSKAVFTGSGRRVLTEYGRQGMGSVDGVGSSTEKMQDYVAAAVFKTAAN
ncbi:MULTISPECIES: hypothetical protein [Gammaproteobacteria]|uniref:hypothetical protein n=1 Tax=Gammaproteobacteria TaxID=1236 RepID=UPI001CB82932|nr:MULTISPECIES: hypothetical protein [Enterobacterales]MDS7769186.1 hypothetical protein [Klebsiella michiganensis]MDS7827043.1 hypothetical protein [Klebsiella michiganensis]